MHTDINWYVEHHACRTGFLYSLFENFDKYLTCSVVALPIFYSKSKESWKELCIVKFHCIFQVIKQMDFVALFQNEENYTPSQYHIHVKWMYQAIQNGGGKLSILDNVYITHRIVG